MPQTIETSVQFRNNDGTQTTDAVLCSLEYDQGELTKRALTRLGLCWLASIGSIPIIFAHWVLVPGFFIAGPIMAMTAYKMKVIPDHADGDCPVCKETISLKLEPKDTFPKWTYCPDCKNSLQLSNQKNSQKDS